VACRRRQRRRKASGRGWYGDRRGHQMARLGIKTRLNVNTMGVQAPPKPKHDGVIDFKNIMSERRFPLGTQEYDKLVRLDGRKRDNYMNEMSARGLSIEHDLKSNCWVVKPEESDVR